MKTLKSGLETARNEFNAPNLLKSIAASETDILRRKRKTAEDEIFVPKKLRNP
jgi:hypothetical protein